MAASGVVRFGRSSLAQEHCQAAVVRDVQSRPALIVFCNAFHSGTPPMSTKYPRAPIKCCPPCALPAIARSTTSAPSRSTPSAAAVPSSSSRLHPNSPLAPPPPPTVSRLPPPLFPYALSPASPLPLPHPSSLAFAVVTCPLPAPPQTLLWRALWLLQMLRRCCATIATALECLSWRLATAAA